MPTIDVVDWISAINREMKMNISIHRYFSSYLSLTVEVEGPLAGDGAVEPRLEERRPLVSEFVRAARVVFAHAGHAGEDGLREEEEGWRRGMDLCACSLTMYYIERGGPIMAGTVPASHLSSELVFVRQQAV